jgi:MEDS: MEthanogen/methylotroph, DcmR Sensory domain
MEKNSINNDWKQSHADAFWGEIAPHDHVLQIYEDEDVFLDTLTGFVGGGINAGDSCVVIATEDHLEQLEQKLESFGIQIALLISEGRYIPLNAAEVLSGFMIDDWPDEELFNYVISEVMKAARGKSSRKIRAFGEMVAILWARGNKEGTKYLEHLWNKYCQKEAFCLFCAYPRKGLIEDAIGTIGQICSAHTKMIAGTEKQMTRILYKETNDE